MKRIIAFLICQIFLVCACADKNVDVSVTVSSLNEEVKDKFSYETVRNIVVQAGRQKSTENQKYGEGSYAVRYKLIVPSEFAGEEKWSDKMYVYLDYAGTKENDAYIDEPSYVLYIDGNGEIAYMYDEGYGYLDDNGYHKEVHDKYNEQYGGGGEVVDTYVFLFEEGELNPYTYDFPEKDEIYNQVMQVISERLKDNNVIFAKVCISDISTEQWDEDSDVNFNVDVYYICDDRICMGGYLVRCMYNLQPQILREYTDIVIDRDRTIDKSGVKEYEKELIDVGLIDENAGSSKYYRVEEMMFTAD